MNANTNIREFRRLDREIESAEADVETKRWRQAELAAEAVVGGISRRQYARDVDKDPSDISRFVAMWKRWGVGDHQQRPRFRDGYATIKAGSDEVVTQSEVRSREAQRQVPIRHDDRVEMAGKLLADPEVVKAAIPKVLSERSRSQRIIETAVSRKNAVERRQASEHFQRRREAEALPLSAYMSAMVVKIDEWAAGLAMVEDQIDTLPDGRGREMVTEALQRLVDQAQACLDRLERPAVIEMRAS